MARKNAVFGLALPEEARLKLRRSGIFVQTLVTVEHQHLAKRYVVHGVESGGAVEGFGHYVTFAAEDGNPLPCLCPVQSLAVNGPHAVVVAPLFIRAEMLRAGETYELLITRHAPIANKNGKRPGVESRAMFRGQHGFLPKDVGAAIGQENEVRLLQFWTRAGEPLTVPEKLRPLVAALVNAVRCIGCSHSHYVRPRTTGVT